MPVESILATDTTVDGGTVSWHWVAPMVAMTPYYIRAGTDVLVSDPGGVAWPGIAAGEWGFTTGLL